MTCTMVVRRSGELVPAPTKREGVRERRLLSREECGYQNMVLIDMDEGAEIELHPYPTSESFFVLGGKLELLLSGASTMLGVSGYYIE